MEEGGFLLDHGWILVEGVDERFAEANADAIVEFHLVGDEVQVFEGRTPATVVSIHMFFQHKLDDIA